MKTTPKKKERKFIVITKGYEFWKPEEGDSIEGEFVEVLTRTGGKYGEKNAKGEREQQMGMILTADKKGVEQQIAMPSTKVLNDFFIGLEKGTYVRITYNGKKTKSGQDGKKNPETYHNYKLEREEA